MTTRTEIKNTSASTVILPSPLHGVLKPGRSVISSKTIAQLEALFNIDDATGGLSGIRLTDRDIAAPSVTTGLESDTIGETAASTEYTPAVTGDYPGTDPDDVADALDRHAARTNAATYEVLIAAQTDPADVLAETAVLFLPKAGTIVGASVMPTAAVTADGTNYGTLALKQGAGAGGARSAVATLATDVAGGSWVAFSAKSLGALTNAAVTAGSVVTLTITKAAAGVQLPSYVLRVTVEPASGA